MPRLDPAPSTLSRADFVARYGPVAEDSPWVAERAFDAGLPPEADTPEGLAAALWTRIDTAPEADRLALLRAHPDLAGRLALAGGLGAASRGEQAGAGLDQCTREELDEFRSLNHSYVAKFGFPFILAVKGRHRTEILAIFRRRIDNSPEAEFAEALDQVRRIIALRLAALPAA